MKIAIVIPYFGQFPSYFSLFLKSCSYNPDIDWLIFTDNEISKYSVRSPENVYIYKMSFEFLRNKIQKKFNFKISLKVPYKLCDYKPAYGYLFSDYLERYDYWGYCDIDILFGNIKKFLPDSLIISYDKIGHLGHLSLYKNQQDINLLFMQFSKNNITYKEIFSTDRIWIFDEWGDININTIFQLNGKRILYWNEFCDIYPYDDCFYRVLSEVDDAIIANEPVCNTKIDKKPLLIMWDVGQIKILYLKNKSLIQQECAYAHFQKRIVKYDLSDLEGKVLCMPDQFVCYSEELAYKCLKKRKIINRKRIYHIYGTVKYFIIEKTGPIRHVFRRG